MNSYLTPWHEDNPKMICKVSREIIRPDILWELGETKGQFALGIVESLGGSDQVWVNFGIRESTGTQMTQRIDKPDLYLFPVEVSGEILRKIGLEELVPNKTYSLSTPIGTIRLDLGEKTEVVATDQNGDLKLYADRVQDLWHLQKLFRLLDLNLNVDRLLLH